MRPRTRLSVYFATLTTIIAFEAEAFDHVERPWAETPERILQTTTDPASKTVVRAVTDAGLTVGSWRSDGAPAIVYGEPKRAPSNISRDAASELALTFARSMSLDLGIDSEDLSVSHVTELEGFTVVTVQQAHLGVPVERAFLLFTFKEGQLAQIRNETLTPTDLEIAPRVTQTFAEQAALSAAREYATDSALVGAELVYWAPGDDASALRLAYAVHTTSQRPRSELDLFIDAVDGALLAVDDDVKFADGEGMVRINVDPIQAGNTKVPFAAAYLDLGQTNTDGDGEVQLSGPVTATYEGPFVRIRDQSGTPVETFEVDTSGPYGMFDHTPQFFSQADPFIHTNFVKTFARQVTPNLGWLSNRITVNVNLNDSCNAFWDGQTMNFYQAGGGCNNTGRISSIVYHEFGHGYHQFLANNIVGSVGEGTGDFLAATILADPIVGRGFASNGSGIRRIDGDNRFPDDYVNQVHEDGLIWASALWDLRGAMIEKHGEWAGPIITNRLFIQAVAQGPGLSTSYPAILAADDDDNDLTNGTPNSCEINAIWDVRGMLSSGQIQHDRAGERAYVRISHDAPGRLVPGENGIPLVATAENVSNCGTFDPADLTLFFSLPNGPSQGAWETAPAADGLPALEPGTEVHYYFELATPEQTFSSGSADRPHVGVVDRGQDDIVREDFEAGIGEWAHGTVDSDLVDDWVVTSPNGQYFDPYQAHSGVNVAGTDLGMGIDDRNGAAKPNRHTFFESGPITTVGMESVAVEVWHHFALDGTLRLLVDGAEVWATTVNGDWSGGWRYLEIPLPESTFDREDPFTARFEIETNDGLLGGWTIDDFAITGIAIPPPPPPEDPMDPPPKDPNDPGTPQLPTDPVDPVGQDPGGMDPADPSAPPAPFARNNISGGCTAVSPEATAPLWILLFTIGFVRRRR